MSRSTDICLCSSCDFVDVIHAIQAANATLIEPFKSDQLEASRDNGIPVAIQSGVNQDVTRGGAYSTVISRFFEEPSQYYRRIGAKMQMSRQAELTAERLYSGFDFTETRIVVTTQIKFRRQTSVLLWKLLRYTQHLARARLMNKRKPSAESLEPRRALPLIPRLGWKPFPVRPCRPSRFPRPRHMLQACRHSLLVKRRLRDPVPVATRSSAE